MVQQDTTGCGIKIKPPKKKAMKLLFFQLYPHSSLSMASGRPNLATTLLPAPHAGGIVPPRGRGGIGFIHCMRPIKGSPAGIYKVYWAHTHTAGIERFGGGR